MDSSYAAAVPALDAYLFSICSVGTRFAIGLCFERLVYAGRCGLRLWPLSGQPPEPSDESIAIFGT